MELEKLLMDLANAFGPSGFEGEVREVFRRAVVENTEITYDNLGGIMATHRGSSPQPKILLAAHLDEVGLMVRGVLPSGYLKVVPLGSWFAPALLAQQVLVRSKNGVHIGVIGSKPPHYMSEDERNRPLKFTDLYIDVGAKNSAEAAALGIEAGNPVVPAVRAAKMSQPYTITGKAFDDRAGCAVVIQVLRELDQTHPNTVIGAGTAQEENGVKGARTISRVTEPDLCLVLEGAPADDFPDAGIIQGRLGGGPQIRRLDPSMIANQALVDLAIWEAQKLSIPFQVAVREGGGTDGSQIQLQAKGGVPTTVIGVPVRYAHSHYGIVNLKDIEATVRLIKGLIQRLDQKTVENLKKNPW
jgi:putative aminopeptidase FrvX